MLDALAQQPAPGAQAGLLPEPAGEGTHAHPRVGREPGQVERLLEVLERPRPGRPGRRVAERGQRPLDELRLAAVAPGRYDTAPGRAVGHLAAVVAAHDM